MNGRNKRIIIVVPIVLLLAIAMGIIWYYAHMHTYTQLLHMAMQPVGSTMYVWGGGWRDAKTGEGDEAVTIGVSPRWAEFAALCDADYDFEKTRFQVHDGLDCSGYIGWLVYNVFCDSSGKPGYVVTSTKVAKTYAKRGWGWYTPSGKVKSWKAGDIMSMQGHVWMSLGMCKDKSVVLVHASPPGVRICGTLLEDGRESQAVGLARYYMQTYYPKWYSRYPGCDVGYEYLQKSSRFRWNTWTLRDDYGYTKMDAAQVLQQIFGERL